MKSKVLFCTAILSLMVTGAAFANDEHPNKHAEKKTGLENALERGNKNETAREAIRRAMERKQGKQDQNKWTIEQRVAADLKELEITFGGTDSKNQVTQAMALPLAGTHGSTISWESSTPSVISNDGQTVIRPSAGQGDVEATLTATVSYGDVSKTKTFTLTVKQQNSETQRVAADKAALAITFGGTDTASAVTQPLALPLSGTNGSTITWVSSNAAIISNDGKTVNRPTAAQGDAVVTFTATITYGAVSDTKSFSLTVKSVLTDAQKVAADKALLTITFGGTDTTSSVTQPLTLPLSGTNGSTITWVSSNASVISNDGKTVQRPFAGSGDASVVLTAILTKGSSSDVKTFTLTVKQQLTDVQRVAADKAALAIVYGGTDTVSSITQAFTLPAVGVNGSSVIWVSGNPSIISNDGKTINRPAAGQGDITVVLSAIISAGGYSDTKVFTVTVKQQLTDAQRVTADKAAVAITFGTSDSASSVKNNIGLPVSGPNGSNVIWVSSNTAVISNSGIVTRPTAASGETAVIMTAVITSGGYAETKAFVLTVKQLP
ncbi:hypothetical protein QFZ77_005828 [Paenibacillus sp. V4I3]|uniref:immunoglobulin-like domain-containing protein n=1 Tax=unclassified Paenibacillus TaxID=185978 RepID=UPI002783BEBE|nr:MULTISPECIES: immunoglobulin-like domain-containing protein [unclassified Paenibacillus]MDQ0877169.1 hypothetical protein [Paenibacillus sp. V4I3]MDQ0886952.1 hypothetical protein [Paenibacillus sp. V4I9]